jgi:hypothetical protein
LGDKPAYQARIGAPFPHDAYLADLTSLRDQLKVGLSAKAPSPSDAAMLPVAEIAGRINALKASQTIEAAPVRTSNRRATAEEPVTTRIRRRAETPAATEAAIKDISPATQAESPSTRSESTAPTELNLPMLAIPFSKEGGNDRHRLSSGGRHDDESPGVIPIRTKAGGESAFQSHHHALLGKSDAAQDRALDATTQQEGRPIMAKTDRRITAGTPGEHEPQEAPRAEEVTHEAGLDPAQRGAASGKDANEGQGQGQEQGPEPRKPIITPDPRPVMSIELGDTKGSPRVQLRRSHKYKQMQIQFERQPDEKYLVMLKQAGWTDRTESEGIWTKQIAPEARWQSVDQMEREFKEVANAIRKDQGLEPVMSELSVA